MHFAGHVSDAELAAYYDVADLFLCASAHEGFCVPIVEAFHKGIPVVAYAASAVPSTMDGAGVLFSTTDPQEVAAIIDAVLDDPALYDSIADQQDRAVARLRARDFDGTLLRYVRQVLAAPRRPPAPVAWDFWDQVRRAEELFELQQYRPAAFQALPYEPEPPQAATKAGPRCE